MNLIGGQFLHIAPLSVQVTHDSVTGSQHAHHQDPDTEAAKWNLANFHLLS